MMPGASARPSAFMVSLAAPSLLPMAAIFPPVTPRSPRTGALPAPSWMSASLMTRSNILAPSNVHHGVTPRRSFPVPSAPNKAMSDANDEALAPARCGARPPGSAGRRHAAPLLGCARKEQDRVGGTMAGLKRRGFVAAAAGLGLAPALARGQAYPNKQVRVVVPY